MKKKFLISTGGSGGHVIPAMAFCDHLKDNYEVFLTLDKRGSKFISKKYKFEIVSVPRLSLNFIKFEILILSNSIKFLNLNSFSLYKL